MLYYNLFFIKMKLINTILIVATVSNIVLTRQSLEVNDSINPVLANDSKDLKAKDSDLKNKKNPVNEVDPDAEFDNNEADDDFSPDQQQSGGDGWQEEF